MESKLVYNNDRVSLEFDIPDPNKVIEVDFETKVQIAQNIDKWRRDTTTGEIYQLPDCPEKYLKLENGRWIEISQEEKTIIDTQETDRLKNILALQIRNDRNQLLRDSDKYMISDYPISEELRQQIITYRQLLRDITTQETFPDSVVWPNLPTI